MHKRGVSLETAVDDYLLALARKSGPYQRWVTQKLGYFVLWCREQGLTSLDAIRPADLRRFLVSLETVSPSGKPLSRHCQHGYGQVVKSLLTWCVKEGLLKSSPAAHVELARPEEYTVKTLRPEDVTRLFQAVRRSAYPLRNKALLAVLLDTGLRLSEVVGLKVADVHLDGKDPHLTVMGKRLRQRSVFVGPETRVTLARYLERDHTGGPMVFESAAGRPLSARAVQDLVKRLGTAAGLPGLHPHQLRHSFSVSYLRAGGSVFHLSRLLGHSNITTTMRYLRDFSNVDARAERISPLTSMWQ
jgi:site-specific recombinase XerD